MFEFESFHSNRTKSRYRFYEYPQLLLETKRNKNNLKHLDNRVINSSIVRTWCLQSAMTSPGLILHWLDQCPIYYIRVRFPAVSRLHLSYSECTDETLQVWRSRNCFYCTMSVLFIHLLNRENGAFENCSERSLNFGYFGKQPTPKYLSCAL